VRHVVRFAYLTEAAAVHTALWEARADIPLRDNFNSPNHIEWVREQCRQRRFLLVEIDAKIAAVMLLTAEKEIFYLVTVKAYQRQGVATALIGYAKRQNKSLAARTKPENCRANTLLAKEGFNFVSEDSGWRRFTWRATGPRS
jgi:GNAT superfamily N-acetyltransferase